MSPENGFNFRTGHNGTQLGQWQLGVHVCGECVEQVQMLCGAHVWSTCVLVQVPPFPNSQALSNVKTVATTPWEGACNLSFLYSCTA